MKYDPIELMKLNITEKDIQECRDDILKGLTTNDTKYYSFMIGQIWLPFIIDMFEDFKFSCEPFNEDGRLVKIIITL